MAFDSDYQASLVNEQISANEFQLRCVFDLCQSAKSVDERFCGLFGSKPKTEVVPHGWRGNTTDKKTDSTTGLLCPYEPYPWYCHAIRGYEIAFLHGRSWLVAGLRLRLLVFKLQTSFLKPGQPGTRVAVGMPVDRPIARHLFSRQDLSAED
jgi:hypothetical protein